LTGVLRLACGNGGETVFLNKDFALFVKDHVDAVVDMVAKLFDLFWLFDRILFAMVALPQELPKQRFVLKDLRSADQGMLKRPERRHGLGAGKVFVEPIKAQSNDPQILLRTVVVTERAESGPMPSTGIFCSSLAHCLL